MKHFLALPLLLLLLAISTVSQAQTVTLDQADLDYAPGETVYITGTEFQPGELVNMTISHIEPGLPLIYHEHASFQATATANGTFEASWYVEDVELNTTLLLMAEGDQGSIASIVFTDGVTALDVTSPTASTPITITSLPHVFRINFSYQNSNPSNQKVTATASILSGTSIRAAFTKEVSWSATLRNWFIDINLPDNFPAGTYNIRMTLTSGNGSNNTLTDDEPGALIINLCTPSSISNQPGQQSVLYGNDATFTVSASGTAPLSYQWQEDRGSGFTDISNGGIYSGATSATLAIAKPTVSMSNYQYRCVVTGSCLPAATSTAATLTVTPRPITITPTAGLTKVYGQDDPTFTYSASEPLLAGDSFSGTLGRIAGNNVATYAYTLNSLSAGPNYTLSINGTNTFAITARPVTITADALSKVYGETDPTFTYQITSGTLAFSDAFTGALTRNAGEAIGDYEIGQGTVVLNSNYTLTYLPANLTISKRAVTITADALSKVYGDADPTFSYQITLGTLVFSDVFTGSLIRDAGESVGDYAITQGSVALNSNYTLSYVPANLTISKREVTITADALSKTYGEADPILTYQITTGSLAFSDDFTGALTREAGENVGRYEIEQGNIALNSNYTLSYVPVNFTIVLRYVQIAATPKSKIYGDFDPELNYAISSGTLAFSDELTGSLIRDVGESVGDYAITQGTVALNSNYSLSYIPANLTISKRPVTITADSKSKVYGETDPTFTYQITSGTLAFSDAFAGSLTRDAGEAIDSYEIVQGTVALNNNYTLRYVPANLTISKREVTITADAKSKVYGDADPALTYQITSGSLAFSDAFTGLLAREAGENVGAYGITQGTVALNANYTLTYVEKNLTIGLRSVEITATPKSKTYGDLDPALTYAISSGTLAFSDVFTGLLAREAGEAVGDYEIGQGTVALNSNYTLSYVPANLTISKREVTIIANALSKDYGDVDPTFTYQITLGTLAFSDVFTGSLIRDAGENVGAYAITQGSVALSNNYTLTYVGANLTISKREVTITAYALSKTYGDADPDFTYQITLGTLAFSDVFAGSLTRDAGENVGDYAITQGTVALNSNYTLSYIPANLTISKREVTITADALSKTYGDNDPALTYHISTGSLAFSDDFTGSLTRDAGENVGDYAITQGGVALNANYTLSYVPANLTISKREVSITADALSKVYGDADPDFTYQITLGTLAFSDVFTGSLTREAGESVGDYAITQGGVALNENYTLSYVPANLTISKREVTITANALSKVYGDADPDFTYQITLGTLAFSDVFTGSLTREAGENVGTYAITLGTVALNSNYALSYVPANLTISKREVTITAYALSKVYGDADPALTYQITSGSLAFSDAFTGLIAREAGENVGAYAITQGTVALNANYTLTYVEKNLTIGLRSVEITAAPKSKTYGDLDPALTYAISSGTLAFSDVFTGSLTRDAGENVGTYAITQGTVDLNSNYTLSYVPANLAISKREVTITANALSKVYGDADPTFTYQITLGTLAFSDVFTGSLTRDAGEAVGAYAIIQGGVALNENYTLSYVPANLTISKREVTITADAKNKIYGDVDPSLSYQITIGSLAFSDAFTGFLAREAGENVGAYAITLGTVALTDNYTLSYVPADLAINARAITITAEAKSKYIGQVDPTFTYEISSGSLVTGDAFSGSLLRETGECADTYGISQGNVSLNPNYTLSYIPANFTIIGVTIDASQSSTPVPTGSTATLSATVTPAAADIAVTFTLDNGVSNVGNPITVYTNSSGIATTTVSSLPVEVYKVTASIGSCASTTAYLAVYDPNGGFVTGGGWITSPAGAYLPNTTLTGKANFGFVSKYKKGSNTPEGNTEFQFQTGNLNFSSSSYSAGSLVIAGSQAIYKGFGTINGAGNYGFMVSAVDGQINGGGNIDKFRIKIWDIGTGAPIYDNNIALADNATPTTLLGGGSIVIHSAVNNKKIAQITPETPVANFEPILKAYPNPFTERLTIEFSYETDTKAKLDIYSVTGSKLETLYDGPVAGGQLYNFAYLPRLISSQVVFYHLTLNGKTKVGKILYNER